MIYYRQDGITHHLTEIAPFPFEDGKPYETMEDDMFHAEEGYNHYKFLTSYMETDEYKRAAIEYNNKNLIETLRSRREQECFVYINRGELWYSKLTEKQKEELDKWYSDWLMVTETLSPPEKPEWLQ